MALIWADFPSGNPGLYGTDVSLLTSGIYAAVDTGFAGFFIVDDPDPNITGNVIAFEYYSGNLKSFRFAVPTPTATLGVGSRIRLNNLPRVVPVIHEFRSNTNNAIVSINLLTNGQLQARYLRTGEPDNTGTILGTSSNAVIIANAWQHVETKVVISSTIGNVEVRVEGVTVLNLTGLNLGGNNIAEFAICGQKNDVFTGNFLYTKDLVIWDGTGSNNNNFLGSVSIIPMTVTSDISLNWTPSTGTTGWDLIDEAPPNTTDFISASSTLPAAAVMALSNLPTDITSVRGIVTITRATKTDGGDGNLQVGLKNGASTALGTNRGITSAYTYWRDVFEVDPVTSAPWTVTSANNAQIQFNRTV
jgi:hypothetical protein